MDYKQYYLMGVLLLTITIPGQAQSIPLTLKSSIKDDMKKDLMKQVNPGSTIYGSQLYDKSSYSPKAIQDDDLTGLNKIYKNGKSIDLRAFDDKYQINPLVITYTSSTPVNQLPAGYVVPVFTGGRWVWANPNTRVDQLVYPSGIDLSGGGKKKMSAKARAILEHVFGMEVED